MTDAGLPRREGGAAGRRDGLEHAEGVGKAVPWLADDLRACSTRLQDSARRDWSIHTCLVKIKLGVLLACFLC